MKRSTIETVLGAVVLLSAAVFLVFSYQTADVGPSSSGYEVTATFSNIGSLNVGGPVQMAGVRIGQITDISLTDFFEAEVTMAIDDDIEIPEDSAAIIASESLLGGNSISIQPGGALGTLGDGDALTHTQPHVSLVELLGKFIYSAGGAGTGGQGNMSGGNSSSPEPFSGEQGLAP